MLALAAAVTAGCTPAPAAPLDPFPPRPADIDIERVDPCATLSPELKRELQVGEGVAGTAPVDEMTTRACGWGNLLDGFNYTIQLIPQDAGRAVADPGTWVSTVAGFGTVTQTERADTFPLCQVLVDVNDGQTIRIQVQTTDEQTDGAAYPVDEVCRRADRVAADAVQNADRVVG
ncbi:DUF3558 family protein [Pseudonocardia nantongensis]|uniref:DUF3558 family protein n=1 Tax=Pseudonocardia nantongensis TaxID=1181885 RepID=UPI00397A22AA